jgi:hypothetical protein
MMLLSPVDYTPSVAVRAAYVVQQPADAVSPEPEHCGLCTRGVIKHADGHTTPCPCPSTCQCKK